MNIYVYIYSLVPENIPFRCTNGECSENVTQIYGIEDDSISASVCIPISLLLSFISVDDIRLFLILLDAPLSFVDRLSIKLMKDLFVWGQFI